MTVAFWQDRSTTRPTIDVDVLVIGAGLSGAATAWWLRDAGLKVAIVDRGHPCAGASGRNAGFVTCGSVEHFSRQVRTHGEDAALALWQLSHQNLCHIEALSADGLDCDFKRSGTYSLASTDHELSELAQTAAALNARGVAVETIDEAHVQAGTGHCASQMSAPVLKWRGRENPPPHRPLACPPCTIFSAS